MFFGVLFYYCSVDGVSRSFFSFSDSVYGSAFFLSTGFHGFHVLIGGLFLFFNLLRLIFSDFSFSHHLGLEFAILY